jgi:hypothetical protein
MHVGQRDVGGVAAARHVGHDVGEVEAADVVIPGPRVGADLAAARDVVQHEAGERVAVTSEIRLIRTRSGAVSPSTAIAALPASWRPPTPR